MTKRGENTINAFVHQLIKKYNTCSPFEICSKIGIDIFYTNLPGHINGFFFNSEKDEHIILINKSLNTEQRKTICAHELAHALLHSNVNSITLGSSNSKLIEKCEQEAECFTKCLLKSKKELDNIEL